MLRLIVRYNSSLFIFLNILLYNYITRKRLLRSDTTKISQPFLKSHEYEFNKSAKTGFNWLKFWNIECNLKWNQPYLSRGSNSWNSASLVPCNKFFAKSCSYSKSFRSVFHIHFWHCTPCYKLACYLIEPSWSVNLSWFYGYAIYKNRTKLSWKL